MPGIITMRLLSYCFGDPNELLEERVLSFLNTFNANTGALDLIQSSWAGTAAARQEFGSARHAAPQRVCSPAERSIWGLRAYL